MNALLLLVNALAVLFALIVPAHAQECARAGETDKAAWAISACRFDRGGAQASVVAAAPGNAPEKGSSIAKPPAPPRAGFNIGLFDLNSEDLARAIKKRTGADEVVVTGARMTPLDRLASLWAYPRSWEGNPLERFRTVYFRLTRYGRTHEFTCSLKTNTSYPALLLYGCESKTGYLRPIDFWGCSGWEAYVLLHPDGERPPKSRAVACRDPEGLRALRKAGKRVEVYCAYCPFD